MDSDGIVLFHDAVVVGNKTQCLYLPDPADAFWGVKKGRNVYHIIKY